MWLRDTVDENASLKILIFNGRINCGDKLLEFRMHVSKKSVQYIYLTFMFDISLSELQRY